MSITKYPTTPDIELHAQQRNPSIMNFFTPELLQRLRAIVESGTPLARNTVLGLIERATEANQIEARAEAGFVIVDIKTRQLDWDGELHPTREAAIESLTGKYQWHCRTPEEATEDRTYYGNYYEILPVTA